MLKRINQIERVDALIRRKATGCPKSLASRLEISERALYRLINLMKELGAPIYFCKSRRSFCYSSEVIWSAKFVLANGSSRNISGGNSNFFYVNFSTDKIRQYHHLYL